MPTGLHSGRLRSCQVDSIDHQEDLKEMADKWQKNSKVYNGNLVIAKLFSVEADVFASYSEAAPYLPQEEKSPLFSVQREGIPEDGTIYRINR